jgi:hypothetical protein
MNMTEQQKARIVELARECEAARAMFEDRGFNLPTSYRIACAKESRRHSAEAFRIAQEARS